MSLFISCSSENILFLRKKVCGQFKVSVGGTEEEEEEIRAERRVVPLPNVGTLWPINRELLPLQL